MNVSYEIKDTHIYGKGIYALADISRGTLVWEYKLNENVLEYDKHQSIEYLETLCTLEDQQHFLDVSFGKNDVLCLILDDGQYMNHAEGEGSNCLTLLVSGNCYAKRDILAGEQLFEDYSQYSHPSFLYPLLKKYDCEPCYYNLFPKGCFGSTFWEKVVAKSVEDQ
jgi:hypothetical protein